MTRANVHVDYTTPGWTTPNPLSAGIHCPTCGTRLDKPERECPMCEGER